MTKLYYARDLNRFTESDSQFIQTLPLKGVGVKIGIIAMTAFHPAGSVASTIIHRVNKHGGDIIFDGKFGDIPYQVAGAIENVVSLNVAGITVRANAETRMLKEAVAARDRAYEHSRGAVKKPILFGVAVLSAEAIDEEKTLRYATKAAEAGFDGMVAPGRTVFRIKKELPQLLTLSVGVRTGWETIPDDDQRQTITHLEAAEAKSDYIVLGRPISHSKNPAATIDRILSDLGNPSETRPAH